MSEALKSLIGKAADGPLTRAEAEDAFGIIMSGEATMAQIGGLLMALRTRGETVDEITGAAAAMRARMAAVAARDEGPSPGRPRNSPSLSGRRPRKARTRARAHLCRLRARA